MNHRAPNLRFALSMAAFSGALVLAGSASGQSLSLPEAREAVTSHPSVAAAQATLRAAETLDDTARALWRPTVELTGAYTFFYDEATFEFANPYAPVEPYLRVAAAANPAVPDPTPLIEAPGIEETVRHQHDVRGDITVSQPVWMPAARPTRDMASAASAEGRAGVAMGVDALEQAVIDVYFLAYRAQRFVQVRERMLALAALDMERSEVADREGVGDAFAVTRARVAESAARRDLDAARTDLAVALDSLAELTGRAVASVEPPADVALPDDLLGGPDVSESAVEARPSVALANAGAERLDALARQHRSGAVPVVLARANASVQREAAFGGDALQWNLQLVASWSLWDGGLRAAEAARATAEAGAARERANAERLAASGEVRRARLRIDNRTRDVAQARLEVELASENVAITDDALAAGVAAWVDVEAAREQLTLSELALADAEAQLLAERYQLARLLGVD